MTTVRDLLTNLDLGNAVAEFDEDLEKYFVETNTFRTLIEDKKDIVAGDKGTGKTALYRIIDKRHSEDERLSHIDIVTAFNPSGNPIFSTLGTAGKHTEAEYIRLWKAYFLSLVGNWFLNRKTTDTLKRQKLEKLITALGLLHADATPRPHFERVVNKLGRLFHIDSIDTEFTFNPDGSMSVKPHAQLGNSSNSEKSSEKAQEIAVETALKILNDCLDEIKSVVWIAMDRLDEAFQAAPEIEIPALRALFRTFLDLQEFDRLKPKLFVRRDLFRRITAETFVNLTHVNARKIELLWNEDDLRNLLVSRIKQNSTFCKEVGTDGLSDTDIFDKLFPKQVDQGSRKPATWVWMMRRIRDGNDVKPPRNLIDLVKFAREAQLKKEERISRTYTPDTVIFEPESIRRALSQLSQERVNDTLLAEAREQARLVRIFRRGKSEHNKESVAKMFRVDKADAWDYIQPLLELGFLEDVGGSYKVPSLYREGLQITQGKAFDPKYDQESAGYDDEDLPDDKVNNVS